MSIKAQPDEFEVPSGWLKPYISVALLRAPDDLSWFKEHQDHLHGKIQSLIEAAYDKADRRVGPVRSQGQLIGCYYVVRTDPGWLAGKDSRLERTHGSDPRQAEKAHSQIQALLSAKINQDALPRLWTIINQLSHENVGMFSKVAHEVRNATGFVSPIGDFYLRTLVAQVPEGHTSFHYQTACGFDYEDTACSAPQSVIT